MSPSSPSDQPDHAGPVRVGPGAGGQDHAVHDELAHPGDGRGEEGEDQGERRDGDGAARVGLPHQPEGPRDLPEDGAGAAQPLAQRAGVGGRGRRVESACGHGRTASLTDGRGEVDRAPGAHGAARSRAPSFPRRGVVDKRAMTVPDRRSDATTAMAPSDWSIERATQYYNVAGWGAGFFSVNDKGHVVVHPMGQPGPTIDLMDVVEDIQERKIGFPCVVRFQDVLRARVKQINEAFGKAVAEMGYGGRYFGVYPIKVNQMREVVEEILDAGAPYHYGLEAGSKGELLVVLGMNTDPEALTICNGYKDEEFLRLALLGRKLGRKVIVVIEKLSELPQLLRLAEEMGVEPMDRPALEAHHARHRQVGGLVRRLRQVRAHRPRAHPRGPDPEGGGQGALREAPPLPRRLPAHRDPGGQGRGERGGAGLREAPQDGAPHRVLRRGRRPGRGLRRHATRTATPRR